MGEPIAVIDQLRESIQRQGLDVTVVVPSYGEGEGIVPTLASLWQGMEALGLGGARVLVSDSSPSEDTIVAARKWASTTSCRMVIDHSEVRRSPKQALNVALEQCDTQIAIFCNADVVVPPSSLAHLLAPLCGEPPCDVVVGVALPDPTSNSLRQRAGAFQLRAVARVAAKSKADGGMRAEGALWGARDHFYRNWRFPVASGSIADDVELARAVSSGGYSGTTAAEAVAYKVPPNNIRDFCLQTRRSFFATRDQRPSLRSQREWKSFVVEASRDPLGAALYCLYRGVAAMTASRWAAATRTETWEPSLSTKRTPQTRPTQR